MNVGIIGAGNIGEAAALVLTNAGHDVAVANSRGPASLAGLVMRLGSCAHAMGVADAVAFGDVVMLAVPWSKRAQIFAAASFAGKTVVDAMNVEPPDVLPVAERAAGSSAVVARELPGAHVVKAFNAITGEQLRTGGKRAGARRTAIPLCGDDAQAKAVVGALIDGAGFDPVDLGGLAAGVALEPGSPVFYVAQTAAQVHDALARSGAS